MVFASMQERQTCVDCGRLSPLTESGHALISKEFGWRLIRQAMPDGSVHLEWRCRSCWAKYKQRNNMGPSSSRDAAILSLSGEHSRWLLDEEQSSAPASPRRPATPEPTPSTDRGLPRKRP